MASSAKRAPYTLFEGPDRGRKSTAEASCCSEKVSHPSLTSQSSTVPGGSDDYGAPYGMSNPSKYQHEIDANVHRLRRKLKQAEERISTQGADLKLAITEANHYKDRIARDSESHRLEIQVGKPFIAQYTVVIV